MRDSSDQKHVLASRLRRVAVGAGVAVAAIGGYFLFGWLSGEMAAKGLQTITIKTNAALSLFVCGFSLFFLTLPAPAPVRRRIAQLLASISLIIGSLTLIQHLSGVDFGIDQLLAKEPPGAVGILNPNRMGPPAALTFTLAGAALLLLARGRSLAVRVAQWLAVVICSVALLGIIGYLYEVKGLYGAARFTVIAWQTTVANFIMGIGILCTEPREGLMAHLIRDDPGGAATRRLIPFALLLPVILGWLRLQGEYHGLYETSYGTSILVLALVLSFSAIVLYTGRQLTRAAEKERRAEDEVRFQRELLQSVVQNMPAGILLARGGDLRIMLVNPQYEAFAAGKEMLGRTVEEVWPEIQPAFGDVLRAVAASGTPYHAVEELFYLARSAGAPVEERYFSWSCVRLPVAGEERSAVLVTAWETTQRKKTEEELRNARDLLRAIIEGTDSHIVALDPDLRFLIFNSSFRDEIFRLYGKEVLVGQRLEDLFNVPEDKAEANRLWRRALQGEKFVVEQQFGDPGRKRVFFEIRFSPIRNLDGEVVGATQISSDISARKATEEALRESEEKYRSLFESTPDAVLVTVPTGGILSANPAAEAMFGMTEEEIRARGRQGVVSPDYHRVLESLVEERSRTGICRGEIKYLRKDGSSFTGDFVSGIFPGTDRAFVIIRDMTERVRLEEALRRAKDELEERVRQRTLELSQALENLRRETTERFKAVEELHRNEQMMMQQSRLAAMGELLENISHQWRQPLNVVGLLLQKLTFSYDRGNFSRELLKENVDRAWQLLTHMSQTMDDFKSFLNPQRVKAPFDVREVVDKAVSMVRESLKEIAIVVEGEGSLPAMGYRNEYAQVIINMLINARDAFRERTVSVPVITIAMFAEEGSSIVTIADNAGGIPEEVIGRIFDPYFTTKDPAKGTGIGLFMSKTIIERNMGGEISVRNLGEGAEFRIAVPRDEQ